LPFPIKNIKRNKKLLIILILLVLVIVGVLSLIDYGIRPAVLSLAEARLKNMAVKQMNMAFLESDTDVKYDDLVSVVQDGQGNVTVIQANTIQMNHLAAAMAEKAQQKLATLSMQTIYVPLGTAIGGQLLSGMGPDIPVNVIPAGSVSTEFTSEFESTGINQTRHRILLILHANISLILSGSSKNVAVSVQFPISETVIVGKVPDSYLNVQSLEEGMNLWSP
jgi:sporulation protein YunB